MRAPSTLPERLDTPLVGALVVASFAATAFMGVLGAPMINATNPSGIIGFELAGSYDVAAAILASWDSAARSAARIQTLWDYFLYIPVYVLAFASSASWCARRLPWQWLARIGVVLAWAMILAGAFDMIENWQLLGQLEDGADGYRAALAAACAYIKFAIVYTTFVYSLLAAICIAVRKLRRPSA